VRELAGRCDVLLVVGSRNSSNSNRLRELAEQRGVSAYLIDGPADIRYEWLQGKGAIGVTAGASAPEVLVQQVVAQLKEMGGTVATELPGRTEHIVFALPAALRKGSATRKGG
jgi:4-hydroxy-3-methylbut-2-en-1-yl diphosphate reductase